MMLSQQDAGKFLSEEQAAKLLTHEALKRGTTDNVTCLVVFL
jgi:hypothetical protein